MLAPPNVTKINQTQMQYGNMPKEGLQYSFHQTYPFLIITIYVQKIISHLG